MISTRTSTSKIALTDHDEADTLHDNISDVVSLLINNMLIFHRLSQSVHNSISLLSSNANSSQKTNQVVSGCGVGSTREFPRIAPWIGGDCRTSHCGIRVRGRLVAQHRRLNASTVGGSGCKRVRRRMRILWMRLDTVFRV